MTESSPFITGMVRLRALWLATAVAGVLFIGCETPKDDAGKGAGTDTSAAGAATTTTAEDPVKRGEYLVLVGGCNDCHTPWKMGEKGEPEPDMTRMLSGHPEGMKMPPPPDLGKGPWLFAGGATFTAWTGPWGISYTANLTPDSLTGTGTWTEEIFMNTLRTGKHWGTSRPIMPPMPWFNLAKMTDDDLKAIFAYLRSIPPIKNQVPAYEPPAGAPTASATPAPTDTTAK
jgi:mono/diheme cytochrome c family protein